MCDIEVLKNALADCKEAEVLREIDALLAKDIAAERIVSGCNEGMCLLGERFDRGEAFIPDLLFSGMVMKKAMEKLEPLLVAGGGASTGKTFVIGTVRYDVHDIGKDITAMLLRGNGFHVIDLGVDVAPEVFVGAVRDHQADFVGMSVLLTTCYKSVLDTMEALRASGLLGGGQPGAVKTCLGGAAASPLVASRAEIDFYGKTAVDTVNWAREHLY